MHSPPWVIGLAEQRMLLRPFTFKALIMSPPITANDPVWNRWSLSVIREVLFQERGFILQQSRRCFQRIGFRVFVEIPRTWLGLQLLLPVWVPGSGIQSCFLELLPGHTTFLRELLRFPAIFHPLFH